ncbi:hypothetical protein NDA11_004139 [Ustilago hordei]|nr:hypothetical protein NDA11_004139 [Ustilago hordei]
MSQSSSISIGASINTAAAVSSSINPFTESQVPLAIIKNLAMHSANALSNPSPSRCVLLAGNAQLRSAKFEIHATALTPNALEIYTAQVLQRKQIYFRWSSAN